MRCTVCMCGILVTACASNYDPTATQPEPSAYSQAAVTTADGASPSVPSVTTVVWKDVTGMLVPVVSAYLNFSTPVGPTGVGSAFFMLDANGQIVTYDYANDVLGPVAPVKFDTLSNQAILNYTTTDCSGAAFIVPLPSRSTVANPRSTTDIRVVPDDVKFTTITPQSVFLQGVCGGTNAVPTRVIHFDELPLAQPLKRVGKPPYHPETISVRP